MNWVRTRHCKGGKSHAKRTQEQGSDLLSVCSSEMQSWCLSLGTYSMLPGVFALMWEPWLTLKPRRTEPFHSSDSSQGLSDEIWRQVSRRSNEVKCSSKAAVWNWATVHTTKNTVSRKSGQKNQEGFDSSSEPSFFGNMVPSLDIHDGKHLILWIRN